MRKRIGRVFLFSALVPLSAAALCLWPQAALGRSPRPGTVAEFGEIHSADPGEDPHLRVDPVIHFEMLENQGSGCALPCGDSVDRGMLGQNRMYMGGTGARSSRVYSKLLIMLRLSVGTFVLY